MSEVIFSSEDEAIIGRIFDRFEEKACVAFASCRHSLSNAEKKLLIEALRTSLEVKVRACLALRAVALMVQDLSPWPISDEDIEKFSRGGEIVSELCGWLNQAPGVTELIRRDDPTPAEMERLRELEASVRSGAEHSSKDFEQQTKVLRQVVRDEGLWHAYSGEGDLVNVLDQIEDDIESTAHALVSTAIPTREVVS